MAGGSSNYTLNIKALFDASAAKAGISDIQNALKNIKLPDKLKTDLSGSFSSANKALDDFISKVNKGIKSKSDANGINKSFETVTKELTKLDNLMIKVKGQLDGADLSSIIKIDGQAAKDLEKINKDIEALQKRINTINADKLKQLEQAFSKIKKGTAAETQGQKALELFNEGNLEEALQVLTQIETKLKAIEKANAAKGNNTTNIENNIKAIQDMQEVIKSAQKGTANLIDEQNRKINEGAQVAKTAQEQAASGTIKLAEALHQVKTGADRAKQGIEDLNARQQQFVNEVEQIKSRIQYFFGLANSIQLVKRAIRGAVDTIKDLDKAMTATAVVTNFTVSDMWKQLPEYTKRANELGVTTQAAYEAATLFYQQGLNTQQAAELSTETLKMARIAGLDAAEATDRMTNALRGFNLELNATQAQRVDDVYSQLAAISASNVDEISTAMTKVASLAHNANMEFETTAAFLAQIIETTRESAETAGTALKTVAARFSEVKKLVDTDQLKGTDEEGQAIDVNKVGAALRTAGIDLNKYFLGEVGLDDIFMELASKWDSLTSIQQRYIATQAAGSRQQSRFIALMQDYARTQELVGAAYNATGASAKQFEKTQESLESKIARLKNAWNEFLMGLSNNVIVKGVVTALTDILNLINKITSVAGNGVGTILKWTAAFLSMAGLRKAFENGGIVGRGVGKLVENTAFNTDFFKQWAGKDTSENKLAEIADEVKVAWIKAAEEVGAAGVKAETQEGAVATAEESAESESATVAELKESEVAAAAELEQGAAGASNAFKGFAQTVQEAPLASISPIEGGAKVWDLEATQFKGFAQTVQDASEEALGSAVSEVATDTVAEATKDVVSEVGAKALEGAVENADDLANATGAAAKNSKGLLGVLKSLGPVLGYVAIAAAAVAAAYALWYQFSPEGQLKQAEKYAEVMNKAAGDAQKNANQLKESAKSYKEYNNEIENASTLTKKKEAIQKRNEAVNSLIEQNPDLVQYVSSKQENGQIVLTIDEKQIEEAEKKAAEGAAKAQSDASLANAALYGAQANVYDAQLRRAGANVEARTITRYDDEGVAYTDTMTAEEFTKYSRIQQAKENAQSQKNLAAKQGYNQALIASGFTDDVANLAAEAMAENFDAQDYLKRVQAKRDQNWANGQATRQQLEAEYMKLYGTQADASMSRKELAKVVAQGQVNEENQDKAKKLGNLLTGPGGENYQALLRATQGTDIASEINLSNVNLEAEDLDITKVLGLDDSNINLLAETLEKSPEELKKQMVTQAKLAKEQQKQQKQNIFEKALNSGYAVDADFAKKVQELSPKMAGMISNIANQATEALSAEGMQALLPQLLGATEEDLQQYTNFFSSFDLNDPINALDQLTKAEENAADGSPFAAMLADIRQTNTALFDTGNLVQSFIASGGYESIADSVSDLIEENGKITANNIEDLAKSCNELQILLDKTTITAQGLAEAFTLFEQGNIPIDNITSSLLAALSAGESFDSLMGKVSKWIEEFNKGTDMKEGTNHIIDVLDEAAEYASNWEFGNEPLENIYNHIFGDDAYSKYMAQNWGKKTAAEIEKDLLGNINRVKKLAENEGRGALDEIIANGDTKGKFTKDKNGNYTWDLSAYKNEVDPVKAAIDDVANSLHVSEDAARAFIESWGSHMYDLRTEWADMNFDSQMKAYAQDLGKSTAITTQ